MKKILVIAVALVLATSCGQSQNAQKQETTENSADGKQYPQSDMASIAHTLAMQIPEIKEMANRPEVLEEHYLISYGFDEEEGPTTLQMYRYTQPATDLILIVYEIENFPVGSWLRCYTHNRKTGAFLRAELPFEMPPASHFNKDEFDDDHTYWNSIYKISDNGDVWICASPSMSYICFMLAHYDNDKGTFTLYRRAGYDYYANMTIGKDDAATEKYVQEVVRPNFQRINDIKKWAYIERKDSFVFTADGATIAYYYSDSGLEKMTATIFHKTRESNIEYYFIDGRLSFIYDVTTEYGVAEYHHKGLPGVKTERRWYLKGDTCIRGLGDNNKKLTSAQIENEFLGNDDQKGAYTLYQQILGL